MDLSPEDLAFLIKIGQVVNATVQAATPAPTPAPAPVTDPKVEA